MKTANVNTNVEANTLNNAAMTVSLFACAALSVAMLIGGKNATPQISQTMEPIVVTAQRMPVIQLATIEVTAKRLTPVMQTVALAPMVIVAKRSAV
jgi:hypothetical protein